MCIDATQLHTSQPGIIKNVQYAVIVDHRLVKRYRSCWTGWFCWEMSVRSMEVSSLCCACRTLSCSCPHRSSRPLSLARCTLSSACSSAIHGLHPSSSSRFCSRNASRKSFIYWFLLFLCFLGGERESAQVNTYFILFIIYYYFASTHGLLIMETHTSPHTHTL